MTAPRTFFYPRGHPTAHESHVRFQSPKKEQESNVVTGVLPVPPAHAAGFEEDRITPSWLNGQIPDNDREQWSRLIEFIWVKIELILTFWCHAIHFGFHVLHAYLRS